MEIWNDIVGYEGLYQASNTGRIRSLNYRKKIGNIHVLKGTLKRNGYYAVALPNKRKYNQIEIHRLIAETFIPNPDNKPCVDHINTIRTDNSVDNLRWASIKENINNPITSKRRGDAARRYLTGKYGINSVNHCRVFQYSLNGKFIKEWDCIKDASQYYNIDSGSISKVCKGIRKTCGSFIWKYEML